ncbi:type 1 glutamine amidotransferase [Gorillibacterium massiliense]|uniref:type 1 glutamine amidotransferase n=1 Tax=Gorillibacterium massiliense TaxID=1280390 RepID=UPI0004B5425B|nr:type 1 glutamine amidotransferase [Gorillibacterium massiliense]
MRLHYVQHIQMEDPGSILIWAKEKDHPVTRTLQFENDPLPALEAFDMLVIMGGPMNIYEEEHFPYLAAEKAFIRESVKAGKIVLGICLGSQLIADAIGGKVTTNPQPEIGWLPIAWTDEALADPLFSFFPQDPVVFQWHYDTFSELPEDAKVLASSVACRHQAFVYKEKVFGFQFHLEMTHGLVDVLTKEFAAELVPAAYVQSPQQIMAYPDRFTQNNAWMTEFLNRLEERIQTEAGCRDGACQL